MVLVTSKTRRACGFTLIELLVVLGIMSILVASSVAMVNGISANQSMSQVADRLASTLESARNTALSHNTYVWVGFLAQTDGSGQPNGLVVAAVESVSGGANDLNIPGNLRPIMKPLFIPNISLASDLAISGMDTAPTDAVDISASTLSPSGFTASVAGTSRTFTQIVQFSAQGETLVQSSLIPWVNVGLRPIHGQPSNFAALQISGTTGGVRLFQP